jgi:hypothetical protein
MRRWPCCRRAGGRAALCCAVLRRAVLLGAQHAQHGASLRHVRRGAVLRGRRMATAAQHELSTITGFGRRPPLHASARRIPQAHAQCQQHISRSRSSQSTRRRPPPSGHGLWPHGVAARAALQRRRRHGVPRLHPTAAEGAGGGCGPPGLTWRKQMQCIRRAPGRLGTVGVSGALGP